MEGYHDLATASNSPLSSLELVESSTSIVSLCCRISHPEPAHSLSLAIICVIYLSFKVNLLVCFNGVPFYCCL